MPAALSAWVCLALNVTAACHLLLLPPRGSLPPAAHSRAPDTAQSHAGNEGDPRADLRAGFCAAGLSVADAVRWPCSSQHRRRATAAVQASAGRMAEHCGGAMDGGGGVDPRPWPPSPFPHPPHSMSPCYSFPPLPPASPSLHPSPSFDFPQAHHVSQLATTRHCHFTTLPAFLPSSLSHSSASPSAPPSNRLQGDLVALGASWGTAEGGGRKGRGGRAGKQQHRIGGEQGGRGSRAQEEQGGREDRSEAGGGGVVWAEGTCSQLFLLEGVV
ncbi:unnamed protein product, partial [Closterium sp. Naga37s-1]